MPETLTYPYLVVSDVHFHAFDFGSHTNALGVNSRLAETIAAFKEAAAKLALEGGKHIVITGDLFHTRGEIKPSVYNPVYDMFKELSDEGFVVHAIPGNHDLETDETTEEGNCFKSFASIDNFSIYYRPTLVRDDDDNQFMFVPWTEEAAASLMGLAANESFRNLTLFCHMGISGVVTGIGNAIPPSMFNKIKGLKYVFSGHFHNHVRFDVDDGIQQSTVFSVGALTHQSFKDVDSLAGYVIVKDAETVEHYETSAPKFVDYTEADWMGFSAGKFVGNYVRMNATVGLDREEITAIRAVLESVGSSKVVNKITPDDSVEKSKLLDPTTYVYGQKRKTLDLSSQFKDYIQHRYDKEMSAQMIIEFEKDKLDEC